jgi:hypothetical protein
MMTSAYDTVCTNKGCGTKMLVLRFGDVDDPIAERQAKFAPTKEA